MCCTDVTMHPGISILKVECVDHRFPPQHIPRFETFAYLEDRTIGGACILPSAISVLSSLNTCFSRTNLFSTPGVKLTPLLRLINHGVRVD